MLFDTGVVWLYGVMLFDTGVVWLYGVMLFDTGGCGLRCRAL